MFNNIDILFILLTIFFIWKNRGFTDSLVELFGFLVSLIFSLKTYYFFGDLLFHYNLTSKALSKALGFFAAWIIWETIFFTITRLVLSKIPRLPKKIDGLLGGIPAFIESLVLFTFLVTFIMSAPVRGSVKKTILSSKIAPPLLFLSQNLEFTLKTIFNDAIGETLQFLTVNAESDESLNLDIDLNPAEISIDPASEEKMLGLINESRASFGIPELSLDRELTEVARTYGAEMLTNNFFSHYSRVDGSSPADRVERAQIEYLITGENLGFAPDVNIAHTGLMNSPGHRANILSAEFKKIGIGVIDGGIYGKMFVQEFTD